MQIIGAGMAGLLAAQMLRRQRPVIREAQANLPHNHEALLRFRTDAVSRATGIPFKRVWVTKGIQGSYALQPIQAANKYSFKVTGEVLPRSILNLEPGERYVAPLDFIARLADGLDITYNSPFTPPDLKEAEAIDEPIISTIPMPAMMRMADWPEPADPIFRWRPVFTTRGRITRPKVDLYQTLYYPGSDVPWYRVSITGQEIIAESMMETGGEDSLLESLIIDFGLPAITNVEWYGEVRQEYGKLAPADNTIRRSFILAMTDRYRVYSLGRFATWRQILLDDVVHDVEVINKFITERDQYHRRLVHG